MRMLYQLLRLVFSFSDSISGKRMLYQPLRLVFSFSDLDSYYVDDAAYVFLSRKDIEDASKLIKSHFTRFGLTVHCGDRRSDGNSKTEAMYIPPPGKTATTATTPSKSYRLRPDSICYFETKRTFIFTIFRQ